MKKPLIDVPSLRSIYTTGYWVTLFVLMFGGVLIFLHYVFIVTLAVPLVGAFHREPKLMWRAFAIVTLFSAVGYLVFKFHNEGTQGLIFFYDADAFGFSFPQINLLSFFVVASIFLPLSGACAFHRFLERQNRPE
ncbi:MAG: hypothetical protein HC904_12710 [Blastochloris sp.]|nr:hypothetical protein [Blastochloris sp.]